MHTALFTVYIALTIAIYTQIVKNAEYGQVVNVHNNDMGFNRSSQFSIQMKHVDQAI